MFLQIFRLKIVGGNFGSFYFKFCTYFFTKISTIHIALLFKKILEKMIEIDKNSDPYFGSKTRFKKPVLVWFVSLEVAVFGGAAVPLGPLLARVVAHVVHVRAGHVLLILKQAGKILDDFTAN
jgi:hypothetical protein